jgi:hypothetical protein
MNTLMKIGAILIIIGFVFGLFIPSLYVVGIIGLVLEGIGVIIMFFKS